jgi:hypothetical protein
VSFLNFSTSSHAMITFPFHLVFSRRASTCFHPISFRLTQHPPYASARSTHKWRQQWLGDNHPPHTTHR